MSLQGRRRNPSRRERTTGRHQRNKSLFAAAALFISVSKLTAGQQRAALVSHVLTVFWYIERSGAAFCAALAPDGAAPPAPGHGPVRFR